MAAANVAGGYTGARTAVARGSGFVRGVFLVRRRACSSSGSAGTSPTAGDAVMGRQSKGTTTSSTRPRPLHLMSKTRPAASRSSASAS